MDASWRARVSNVESLVVLGPISGWEDQPLVSLQRSTKDVPVEHIALHAEVAYEAGEEYKRTHPDDPRSVDQLGSVHLYSQGWADAAKSLYAVLNATLSNANRELLKVWFLFIKLLMTALAFEPKYEGVVWRGVAADIGGQYKRGQKFRWWRFSSCTENGDVLHNPLFLGDSGKRTLFSIDCKTGVKIQHLSAFQAEAEVLLAAGTRFEVTNTITTGDLTVVSLREIQSGLPPLEAMPPEPDLAVVAAPVAAADGTPPIRTLAALSDATQETVQDLLGYSATDLEQVFVMFNVDVITKNRIKREMDGMRALIEPEPEEEPEPEPETSRVLVAGGHDGSSSLSTAEVYDLQSNSWSSVAPMGTKRSGAVAVVLPGPRVLVVGGHDGSSRLNTAEVYDPQSNSWSSVMPMGTKRSGAVAVVLPGPRVLVVGGHDGSSRLNTAEVYDPQSNSWSSVMPMGTKRSGAVAVVLPGPRVLVVGGHDGSSRLNTAEVYDPQSNSWSSVMPMGTKRSGAVAVVLPGPRVLVVGGHDGSSRLSTAEVYDPQSNSWSSVMPMGTKRSGAVAVVLPGPRVLVVGGRDGSLVFNWLSTAEVYDPQSNSWSRVAPMGTKRADAVGVGY